jgi:tetratricopeptide (TPR) repeat protein
VRFALADKGRCCAEAAAQRQLGNAAFRRGAFAEAADVYSAALRLCPGGDGAAAAPLFANRAAALQRLGHAAAAERDCSRAIALDAVRAAQPARRLRAC